MSAEEFDSICPEFIAIKTNNNDLAFEVLRTNYKKVTQTDQFLRIYDDVDAEMLVMFLYKKNMIVEFTKKEKISLEEFYLNINGGESNAK